MSLLFSHKSHTGASAEALALSAETASHRDD